MCAEAEAATRQPTSANANATQCLWRREASKTAPARHRTLRAAVSWSYDWLTEPEQRLFARLSVFVGAFTLDAAEHVCDDDFPPFHVLDLLTLLISPEKVPTLRLKRDPDGLAA